MVLDFLRKVAKSIFYDVDKEYKQWQERIREEAKTPEAKARKAENDAYMLNLRIQKAKEEFRYRIHHCWYCKKSIGLLQEVDERTKEINNSMVCTKCFWIICSNCNKCNCYHG